MISENITSPTLSAYAVAQMLPPSALRHLFALPVERQAKILQAATQARDPKAYVISAVFKTEIDLKRRSNVILRQARREAEQFAQIAEQTAQELHNYTEALAEFRKIRRVFGDFAISSRARGRAWEAVAELTLVQRISGDELLTALRAAGFYPDSVNASQQWLTRARKTLKLAGASGNLLKQLRAGRGDYKVFP